MGYSLFYNHKACGDVLMIVINPCLSMTKYENIDNITVIYHDKEIIGYNIFNLSQIIKIHYRGLIVSNVKPLINVINNILLNHDLPTLDEGQTSSFIVGKVVDVVKDIYYIDIKNKIVQVKSPSSLSLGDVIVVVLANTMMPNGRLNCHDALATREMLMIDDSEEVLKLGDNEIGIDFYSGDIKWSN